MAGAVTIDRTGSVDIVNSAFSDNDAFGLSRSSSTGDLASGAGGGRIISLDNNNDNDKDNDTHMYLLTCVLTL